MPFSQSKYKIDLNLDAGENRENLFNGYEESLYRCVSSVNIACGGHYGDNETMTQAVQLAKKYKLNIGAHPSYPDLKNFGREMLNISKNELLNSIKKQITSLIEVCLKNNVEMTHIKPHGALYNQAAVDSLTGEIILTAITELHLKIPVMALADSRFSRLIKQSGLDCLEEVFIDRAYESNATLRSRKLSGAVITDADEVRERALKIVENGTITDIHSKPLQIKADTICIHGDNINSLAIAEAVHHALKN